MIIQVNVVLNRTVVVDSDNRGKKKSCYIFSFPFFAQWPFNSLLSSAVKIDHLKLECKRRFRVSSNQKHTVLCLNNKEIEELYSYRTCEQCSQ